MRPSEQALRSRFNQGPPPANDPAQLLCEDDGDVYVLPFLCVWVDGSWHNVKSNNPIGVKVVGWRAWIPTSKQNTSPTS